MILIVGNGDTTSYVSMKWWNKLETNFKRVLWLGNHDLKDELGLYGIKVTYENIENHLSYEDKILQTIAVDKESLPDIRHLRLKVINLSPLMGIGQEGKLPWIFNK